MAFINLLTIGNIFEIVFMKIFEKPSPIPFICLNVCLKINNNLMLLVSKVMMICNFFSHEIFEEIDEKYFFDEHFLLKKRLGMWGGILGKSISPFWMCFLCCEGRDVLGECGKLWKTSLFDLKSLNWIIFLTLTLTSF